MKIGLLNNLQSRVFTCLIEGFIFLIMVFFFNASVTSRMASVGSTPDRKEAHLCLTVIAAWRTGAVVLRRLDLAEANIMARD